MSVSRIHRLLRLVTILQSGQGKNVSELAAELEVSRRTVFRDLNMLELAHIPYYFDREQDRYKINHHFFLPPVNLTMGEALALMVMSMKQRTTTSLPLAAEASRAAMKLESVLPPTVRAHIGSMMEHLQIRPAPSARHEGLDAMLDRLMDATARRRIGRMTYDSFFDRKQITLTIHPLRLTFIHRAWYLLAFSTEHKEIRTFKVGRIKLLDVLPGTFAPPDPAVLENHFGDAWNMIPEGKCHDVRLRFDKEVAGNVAEVQWHRTQSTQWNEDGSLDFRVHVDGLGEISWWILGYGDKVKVLSPAPLAKKMQAIAQRVDRLYQGQGELA